MVEDRARKLLRPVTQVAVDPVKVVAEIAASVARREPVNGDPDCRRRRAERPFAGKEELWRQWMREEDEFFAADGTRDRADIIVDTSMFGVDSAQ